MNERISSLTVFYDPECGVCSRFRAWLEGQSLWVAVEFIGYATPEADERMPELRDLDPGKDCVVLADNGYWWQGADSWLVCLWATREYRLWSTRLAAPLFKPLLIKVVDLISSNRLKLSQLMGVVADSELAAELRKHEVACADGTCQRPEWRSALAKGGQR